MRRTSNGSTRGNVGRPARPSRPESAGALSGSAVAAGSAVAYGPRRPASRPIVPGGTPKPTPTRRSTATSSAPRTSSGVPRDCASRTRGCSATRDGLAGRVVVEVGCGAAQCARWLAARGARVVAVDLSAGQLRHARALDGATGVRVGALVQADASRAAPAAEERRRRLLRVRRGAVRRGQRRAAPRGRPGAAPGRALGLLRHAPDAVVLPGRPRPGRADRGPVLLRPAQLRRGRRGRPAGVRRAAPHAGRPGPRDRRGRVRAAGRRGTRVAGRARPRVGAVEPAARGGCSPAPRSTCAASPARGPPAARASGVPSGAPRRCPAARPARTTPRRARPSGPPP